MNTTDVGNQWFKQVWATILFLVIFPPVGIYLMFKYRDGWSKNMKLGLGIASIALFLLVILGSLFGGSDESRPVNAEVSSMSSLSSTSSLSDAELVIDILVDNAEADAKTATKTDLKNAVNYIRDNVYDLFDDDPKMQTAMYYGLLLENYYKTIDENYAKVGTLAYQTIARVYLGDGFASDSTTKTNLDNLVDAIIKIEPDLFAEYNPSNDSSAELSSSQSKPPVSSSQPKPPASSVQSKPPVSSSQPKPPASSSKETVSKDPNQSVQVYRTRTGKRYHYDNSCNGGTYYPCTLAEALDAGLTPCEKCVH